LVAVVVRRSMLSRRQARKKTNEQNFGAFLVCVLSSVFGRHGSFYLYCGDCLLVSMGAVSFVGFL
jgi:hypothetical protein